MAPGDSVEPPILELYTRSGSILGTFLGLNQLTTIILPSPSASVVTPFESLPLQANRLEAVQKAEDLQPDLILLDVNLLLRALGILLSCRRRVPCADKRLTKIVFSTQAQGGRTTGGVRTFIDSGFWP